MNHFETHSKRNTVTKDYAEIYRIVSAKTLDNGGDGAQATLGTGTNISLSKPADEGAEKGGKCC